MNIYISFSESPPLNSQLHPRSSRTSFKRLFNQAVAQNNIKFPDHLEQVSSVSLIKPLNKTILNIYVEKLYRFHDFEVKLKL